MEDELFWLLYEIVQQEAKHRSRLKRVQYCDAQILLVAFWAVLHDRPMCWACCPRNWSARFGSLWLALPSPSTLSVRLRRLSLQLLLEQVFYRLLAAAMTLVDGFCLCRRLDSKPLPVGIYSKDRDARCGHVGDGMLCRGYKLFGCWGKSPTAPEAVVLGPMNCSDQAGAMQLIGHLEHLYGPGPGSFGGYLLADSTHDTNPLHEMAAAHGLQLLAPRKKPQSGLGHREHAPARLRCIQLLEGEADPLSFASNPASRGEFGPSLYRQRTQVERDLGNATSFGGGLQPLPAWVRRPHRVVLWTVGKLIINALRICRNQGLTP